MYPFRLHRQEQARIPIKRRFEDVLKKGLKIGGRLFQFLGYSTSGLREHTVWFMADFEHPTKGAITAERVRTSLGDFSGCIKIPSKYAARIAQAFSSTDPSVRIKRSQWEIVPDLGTKPYEHTDGQGTISPGLRDLIWDALVEARPSEINLLVKPSAVSPCMDMARLSLSC